MAVPRKRGDMGSSIAPIREPIISWVTPTLRDVVFYIQKSWDMPATRTYTLGDQYTGPHAADYPNHKLVFVSMPDEDRYCRFYYAAERENQDEYNWEFMNFQVGGISFDAVRRSYLVPRDSYTPVDPLGATMPNVPAGKFDTDFVLFATAQKRVDEVLDSTFVEEERTYIQRVSYRSIGFDESFGGPLPTTQIVYHKDETLSGVPVATLFATPSSPYWGLQASGIFREGQQIDPEWYVVTERTIVPSNIVAGRTYETTVDFTWPAVLASIDIDTWELREGGYQMYTTPLFSKETYSGPCKAVVTEQWHSTAPTRSVTETLLPMPINMATPMIDLSIGPTLHNNITVELSVGSNHPRYTPTVGSWTYPATNYTSWPASLLVSSKIEPARGGFVKTDVTVYSPS